MKKEKEIFIKEFVEQIGWNMYDYEDAYDYSQGMKRMDDKLIESIAEDFFEEIFINNKELRKLKLRKIMKD